MKKHSTWTAQDASKAIDDLQNYVDHAKVAVCLPNAEQHPKFRELCKQISKDMHSAARFWVLLEEMKD